jgi:glutamate carboxypeptidase
MVSSRKGSGNFTAIVTGRSAHAGRDPHLGRNAIHALGELIVRLAALNGAAPGITVNVGRVEGGGAVNVVPDRASCRFNVRVSTSEEQRQVEQRLAELAAEFGGREGYGLALHGSFTAPPKPAHSDVMKLVSDCGQELGMRLQWRPSGGTCDGNRLAAAGLPNVDSLGPRGGGMHSPGEFLVPESLTERAKLTALLLMKLAAGELEWNWGSKGGR